MIRRLLACALPIPVVVLLVLAGAGCATDHHINVESNTCWIGVVDNQFGISNECGNVNFRVAGNLKCITVTNLNDTGYVRVRIDGGAWVESTAPRGVARACR